MLSYVFVYGTLCRGERNHHVVGPFVREAWPASMKGVLFDLSFGYPAMIAGDDPVYGELVLLTNAEEALRRMDELEDYREGDSTSEYERVIGKATTADGKVQDCYVYLYAPNRREWLLQNGTPVPGGDWREFRAGNRE